MKIRIELSKHEAIGIVDTINTTLKTFNLSDDSDNRVNKARKTIGKNVTFTKHFPGGTLTRENTTLTFDIEEKATDLALGVVKKIAENFVPVICWGKNTFFWLKNIGPMLHEITHEYREAFEDTYVYQTGTYWNLELGLCAVITRKINKYGCINVATEVISGADQYSCRTIDDIIHNAIKHPVPCGSGYIIYNKDVATEAEALENHEKCLKSVKADWEGTVKNKSDKE